jgi:hypothetical protein
MLAAKIGARNELEGGGSDSAVSTTNIETLPNPEWKPIICQPSIQYTDFS